MRNFDQEFTNMPPVLTPVNESSEELREIVDEALGVQQNLNNLQDFTFVGDRSLLRNPDESLKQ